MSQTTVTKHYSVRKRNIHNFEGIKRQDNIVSKGSEVKHVLEKLKTTDTSKVKTNPEKLQENDVSTFIEKKGKSKQSTLKTFFTSELDKPKNDKVTSASDRKGASVPAISLKDVAESGISSLTCSPKQNLPVSSISIKDVAETDITLTHSPKLNLPNSVRDESKICSLSRSPKRNLTSPTDEGTPSKRKHLESSVTSEIETVTTPKPKESARRKLKLGSDESRTVVASPGEKLTSVISLKTDVDVTVPKVPSTVETSARRKLRLNSPSSKTKINVQLSKAKVGSSSSRKDFLEIVNSPNKEQSFCKLKADSPRKLMMDSLPGKSKADNHLTSPKKNLLRTPDKLDALIDSSRSTMVLSPKLDELKKALRLFSEKTGTLKGCHTSPRKSIVPSSPKSAEKKLPSKRLFANERFGHLAQTESLVLPLKYKMLAEIFRNMDALVATLNNRKEKITFENVKEGLQKIMKKNISEKHLGQILTVFPSAYCLSREKATFISKKNNAEYPLVIVPNIAAEKDDNQKTSAFQPMTPTCLANRINEFNNNLLDIVKGHHQDFLKEISFATVSNDSIKQWHPKFPVDTVPDVPSAELPESPEMKIYTARDVLNKFKGSIPARIEKALQSVADESEKSGVTLELEEIKSSKSEVSRNALKGISIDLLEKIRAKESAKLLKTMTQTPEEKKKLAMMERVPKIARIVLHYFISERKSALPVDSVVEKIIHSFNSLSTPGAIKEHLELISEEFPHWLKFIQIPKGLYLTINKKTNVNEMLAKAGMH